jgi:hypothetical protein
MLKGQGGKARSFGPISGNGDEIGAAEERRVNLVKHFIDVSTVSSSGLEWVTAPALMSDRAVFSDVRMFIFRSRRAF